MDGVSRASGAGFVITKIPKCWKGRDIPVTTEEGFDEYRQVGMRIEMFAIVENHLLKDRPSPIDAIMPELEKLNALGTPTARKLAKQLQEKAYKDLRASKNTNKITIEEMESYLDSIDGLLFTLKLCLQPHHPNITDAEVLRIIEWQDHDAKRLRDLASGSGSLGNWTGPTAPGNPPAGTGPSNGGNSTADSPKSTDGPPQS